MPKTIKLDARKLRAAFREDLAAAWRRARELHPDETPYAFVLNGAEGDPRLDAVVLTEESLTAGARHYVARGYYENLEESRGALRWSVEDSPNLEDLFGAMPNVDALVDPWAPTADETAGYKRLAEVAVKAWRDLDAQGLFGKGKQREQLLLAVVTAPAEVDLSLPTAKKLNSKKAYERFEKQTALGGVYRCCDAIAFKPHDSLFWFAGCRANDPPDPVNEFTAELVGAKLTGRKISRRGAFEFPLDGDSIESLAWDESTSTLLAMRSTYGSGGGCKTALLRFESGSALPGSAGVFEGEPSGFGVSPDGARIVVCLQRKQVVALNGNLEVTARHKTAKQAFSPLLLRSGRCLLASDAGVVQFDLKTGKEKVLADDGPAYRLSTDKEQRRLAVSRWFNIRHRGVGSKERPFGVRLYTLSSMRLKRTLEIEGCQCVNHAQSDDGRLVAFDAQAIATRHEHLVVFDTQSGKEVARRRHKNSVNELAFLPGGHTLAIGASDHRDGEPIDFWDIPID